VTLGVSDLARASKFYEAMGMRRRLKQAEGVAFFDASGVVISLWSREALAKDSNVEDSKPGFSGIALAYNVASEPEVDAVLQAAKVAGGKILKPAQRAFWGGFYGHFSDPDGHIWEVAHNPGFAFDDHGNIVVPD
jgi:predicted lactoylglutathione lyase